MQNVDDQARIKEIWNEISLAAFPAFWRLMDEVDRVAVLLGNGTVVDALPELVRGPGEPEESSSSNMHISLNVGTVGSSEAWWLGEGQTYFESEFPPGAHVHYGPFLGLPVLLPERFLRIAAGAHPVSTSEAGASALRSPAQLARLIIEATDRGDRRTRPEWEEALRPLPKRLIDSAWRLAREERKQLSAPGGP